MVEKFLKFQNFHILREINFQECRRSKTAVFPTFGTLHLADLVIFSAQKVQKVQILKNLEVPKPLF